MKDLPLAGVVPVFSRVVHGVFSGALNQYVEVSVFCVWELEIRSRFLGWRTYVVQ